MAITTADIKNGLTIEFNDQFFQIVSFQHVKPGKGPAFVRTKLKNLKTGRTIENTFSSGVRIDVVRIERRPYQFLYQDEAGFNFMNAETFEQISIDAVIQKEPGEGEDQTDLIMLTHQTREKRINTAIAKIEALKVITGKVVRIRLEELGK